MSYSDFDLKKAKYNLGINLIEKQNIFAHIKSFAIKFIFRD